MKVRSKPNPDPKSWFDDDLGSRSRTSDGSKLDTKPGKSSLPLQLYYLPTQPHNQLKDYVLAWNVNSCHQRLSEFVFMESSSNTFEYKVLSLSYLIDTTMIWIKNVQHLSFRRDYDEVVFEWKTIFFLNLNHWLSLRRVKRTPSGSEIEHETISSQFLFIIPPRKLSGYGSTWSLETKNWKRTVDRPLVKMSASQSCVQM